MLAPMSEHHAHRAGRALATITVAAIAGGASGCSWLTVPRAPTPVPPPDAPLACTTARDAPIGDAALTAFLWATTVTLLACPGEDCRSVFAWSSVAASAVLGVATLLSTSYGFAQTRRCHEAHLTRERWREAALDPLVGTGGHPCRPPGPPPCDPGLECIVDRCAPASSSGGEGQPCALVPGTRSVRMCRAGLRCVQGTCVKVAP